MDDYIIELEDLIKSVNTLLKVMYEDGYDISINVFQDIRGFLKIGLRKVTK